ncbi:MAG: H-type lectin domain-containing protein, partial [Acidobacteriota bacterium]|nr:H-type lectin domain-containing protein [Acidobacteriota bacterium]
QLYLDSGAHNSAALIFRTAPTGGTITERMRVTASGNVGVGTTTPQSRLDVRGDIRLGFSGQFRATAGEENLRIIRGVVDGAGNIIVGSGFTVSHGATGQYTITFNTSFAGPPAVMAAAENDTQVRTVNTAGVTSSIVNLRTYFGTGLSDVAFHFIAIGPR